MASPKKATMELKISSFQIGSQQSPRWVWGVGIPTQFVQGIPEAEQRVKLIGEGEAVYVKINGTGIKLNRPGQSTTMWAKPIGLHHMQGLGLPDAVVSSVKVAAEWQPKEGRFMLSNLPDVMRRALGTVAHAPRSDEEQFPGTHFVEDVRTEAGRAMTAPDVAANLPEPQAPKKIGTRVNVRERRPAYQTKRQPIVELEDLRDDCIAVVMNSGMTFKGVAAKGGPSPQTQARWLYRETKFPQAGTIRSILRACGYDLTIGRQGTEDIKRVGHDGIQYPGYEARQAKKRAPRSPRLVK